MDTLPNAAELGRRLRETALRGVTPVPESSRGQLWGTLTRADIDHLECPVPGVMALACSLVGLRLDGPGEKVAWWTTFMLDGARYELAHQKFGLRLCIATDGLDPADVEARMRATVKRLVSATKIVEKEVSKQSQTRVDQGDATVINQHSRLHRVYEYFRDRAISPAIVEDLNEESETSFGKSWLFRSGQAVMDLNSSHDTAAAVTAYLSRFEHDLVLALPFAGFDPAADHLTRFIGMRWGLKFDRIFGKDKQARALLKRLVQVVEAWRNPYAHGGFEKGHGSTVYVHVPVAGALPIGLSAARASPSLALGITHSIATAEVFALFEEIDEWFAATWPQAFAWIDSGLAVRFDAKFVDELQLCRGDQERFTSFLSYSEHRQDQIDNMDY
ncbi:hypothetical protein M0722_13795 [Microbacterium sp. KSW4-16]|uniref:hypothetical protein n=1 Tax=Microbacterium aurugineum TaxID=2851642 RepID=UPI0020C05A5D|nr:hypothetical protein [Microbacterium aurugineum]MCK8468268.1 hypothetical protein [Microbacterium aurugineum]